MGKMRLTAQIGGTTEGFCLVKSVAARTDVKGSEYLDFVLADSEGECVAKLWNYSRAYHGVFEPDDIIKVRGSVQIWKDNEQFKIDRIRHVTPEDDVDMNELVPCAPFDPVAMYDELYDIAQNFKDDDLRRLVQYLLRENREQLLLFPAGVKLHHATRSGLLHHTLSVVHMAQSILQLYPWLNGDLLLAGATLHDIGKLVELDTGTLGLAGAYTAAGQLLGHISIGMSMVAQAAEVTMVPPEKAMLVEHMLLSHHGNPEYGSPRLPMVPEAEVLSVCDLLDSRLYEMHAALETVAPGGFTERIWALDNRQLYKE
ncbi:MAG: HD domain-containing protein [Clostridia bacterium]|nr:HD domain-containing protein [Clostridia bacterium]MBR3271462.1 HD domain-containing protein [Clostridia bacterium]